MPGDDVFEAGEGIFLTLVQADCVRNDIPVVVGPLDKDGKPTTPEGKDFQDRLENELKRTKRFELGKALAGVARHLLLMTATPHAGDEEDFQAFLTLLDADRFAGQFREGHHRINTDGIMRRMVKEELLTFEGKPLFPERRA